MANGRKRIKALVVFVLIVCVGFLVVKYGLPSEEANGAVVVGGNDIDNSNQEGNQPGLNPITEVPKGNDLEGEPQMNEQDRILEEVLILVNRKTELSSQYVPEDLVVPNVKFSFEGPHEKQNLRRVAANALEELFKVADEEGITLYAVSGYRSYARQKSVYNGHVQRLGEAEANKVSAVPGQSEHQTGLAMDVTSQSVGLALTESFGETKEGKWLADNAHRFGFIIRYPKNQEDITGYSYEPWHIRYVGKEAAQSIYNDNLTLETFLSNDMQ